MILPRIQCCSVHLFQYLQDCGWHSNLHPICWHDPASAFRRYKMNSDAFVFLSVGSYSSIEQKSVVDPFFDTCTFFCKKRLKKKVQNNGTKIKGSGRVQVYTMYRHVVCWRSFSLHSARNHSACHMGKFTNPKQPRAVDSNIVN